MYAIELDDFDIEQIAQSGQCFRINKTGDNRWTIIAFSRKLNVFQFGTHCGFDCSEDEFLEIWYDYFDLQTDYSKIKQMVKNTGDNYLINAVNFGYGVRVLRQDIWEMVVSYIISQQNNITRIKNIIERICQPFSDKFPTAIDLQNYTILDFQNLGLGYRAKFLFEMVQNVVNKKIILENLGTMPYDDLIQYLKQFNGIGDKVANCIALFGLHKTEAFPIDVWMRRIINTKYSGNFDYKQFGKFAGIIQQYMFFYERCGMKK
jgi:N-glycosylase/DNA lyase